MSTKMTCCLFCLLLTSLLLLIAAPSEAASSKVASSKVADEEVLNRVIVLEKSKETIYRLLGQVSKQTGYLFIYDSKLVDNEQVIRLKGGARTVRQAIYEIIGNSRLELRIVGNHILIYQPIAAIAPLLVAKNASTPDTLSFFTIEGVLRDRYSQEPVPYATVSVAGTSVGNVTNQSGKYRLHLPDSLQNASISFSHLGYVSQIVEASLLRGDHNILSLEPKIIPIQEVIIRVANPARLLREMLEFREKNCSHHPVYLTTFYREGIERKSKFVNLTEGVFRVYKTSYRETLLADQVKLLKMRTISNRLERDTFITKIKSGIDACLQLDLLKNLPDFLSPDTRESIYTYVSSDMAVINNRVANVICFEQRKSTSEPYYCGELYIDSENSALLQARFEINPRYVTKTADIFVERKARGMSITPQKAVYIVSYKPWNGTYYINHVRGDIHFKVKKKHLFSSFTLHTWFEMVTCKIDTVGVTRFGRKEKLPTRTIFADTRFKYDESFWEDFNVIPPEAELSEALDRLSFKIEETGY